MSVSDPLAVAAAARPTRHESFLAYDRGRYLKLAVAISVASLVLYLIDVPYGSRYGGTWAGYILGTVGALLILWLTWFGYRKRSYAEGQDRLSARLSAHVYFGLALTLIATLHTGFHFGWNVHTLAYALMCIVIGSGIFGVFSYRRYPRLMTANRANLSTNQMLGRIAALNDELRSAAIPLDDETARVVERAVERTEAGGSTLRQISARHPHCATAAAIAAMDAGGGDYTPEQLDARRGVRVLLDEKQVLLNRLRRDIQYKALMDIWLYVHVPITFALIAALIAHIVSVFFFF